MAPRRLFLRCAVVLIFAVAAAMLTGSVGAHAPADAGGPSKQVSFSVLEDYDKGDDLQEPALDFALMHELGIPSWRGSLGWDDYEPTRGQYDFAWLRQFLDVARREGITLRPYVGYTPEWAARRGGKDTEAWNNPPADLNTWRRFVRALMTVLREYPNVASLEIYNEENVAQWWDGDPTSYATILAAAGRIVHRSQPRLPVVFGGLVFPDLPFVRAVCEQPAARRAFDVLPVHAYPETWTPPDVTVENYLDPRFDENFAAAADAACGPKEIWINETGFATTPGRSEEMQAAWWVRAVATFLSHPRVTHIGVYEIKDLNPAHAAIGDTPNYHLGLTYVDRRRKLAFSTVRMLASLLNAGRLTIGDCAPHLGAPLSSAYCHLFIRPDGDQVLLVWTRDRAQVIAFAPGDHPPLITEYALDGQARPQPLAPNTQSFDIALTPGIPRVFRLHPRP